MGCELEQDYELYRSPSEKVMTVIEADMRGVAYPRDFRIL
ncbi:hypothetical protein COLO4_26023 [Corchorus olitorius]|uniref:Uncharacterized protein n=1 Tax=Corchorus olitorius TaxID=93759 RepID=A0A1R3HYY9_9ROSI|nr:hypothetical protein COLO4_26023 [Corchorus olitorius]